MINVTSNVKFYIKIIATIFMLIIIFSWVDLNSTIEHIKKMSLVPYILVILGHFVLMAIKSYRWKVICAHAQIDIPYKASLLSYIVAFAFGTFTPGQVGDFSKAYFVKKYSDNTKKILGTVLIDRIWDLIVLILFTITAVIYLFPKFVYDYWYILIFILIGTGVILLKTNLIKKYIINHPWILLDYKKLFAISLFAAIIQLSRWMILAYAFDLQIILSSMIATIGSFVALIPISISGLGSRDAILAYLFNLNHMLPSEGVAFSMMMFNAYVIGALAGAMLFAFIKKEKIQ